MRKTIASTLSILMLLTPVSAAAQTTTTAVEFIPVSSLPDRFGSAADKERLERIARRIEARLQRSAIRRGGQPALRVRRSSRRTIRRRVQQETPAEAPSERVTRQRRSSHPLSQEERVLARKLKRAATTSRTDMVRYVFALTNEERIQAGLPRLKYNSLLEQAAVAHATDMHKRDYFSHTTPEGLDAKGRIQKTGYLDISFDTCNCRSWRYGVAENIAKGQTTAERAMESWMNSPGHRANILSEVYDEIGIGVVGNTWVQNFGVISTVPR